MTQGVKMEEYKVSYKITFAIPSFLGFKEIVRNGIRIIKAESYYDAQKAMEKEFEKIKKSDEIAVLPMITNIELLN